MPTAISTMEWTTLVESLIIQTHKNFQYMAIIQGNELSPPTTDTKKESRIMMVKLRGNLVLSWAHIIQKAFSSSAFLVNVTGSEKKKRTPPVKISKMWCLKGLWRGNIIFRFLFVKGWKKLKEKGSVIQPLIISIFWHIWDVGIMGSITDLG